MLYIWVLVAESDFEVRFWLSGLNFALLPFFFIFFWAKIYIIEKFIIFKAILFYNENKIKFTKTYKKKHLNRPNGLHDTVPRTGKIIENLRFFKRYFHHKIKF